MMTKKELDADNEFWKIAAEEVASGDEVTVCSPSGHLITCGSLEELWKARAEFASENVPSPSPTEQE